MKANKLFELLSFPAELIELLQKHPHGLTEQKIRYFSAKMRNPKEFEKTAKELRDTLNNDVNGYKILNTLLEIACDTYETYKIKGISENVFIQTQKCFLRFALEHKESFGVFGFDRFYWVGRQLSLLLFRIGELEYEMVTLDGKKAISLHIPSDAVLTDENVDNSLNEAREFIKTYYPEYNDAIYYCSSWLLSPALKNLLNEDSKILKFASRFKVTKHEEEPEDYKIWVYGKLNIEPKDFAEKTSLQRNIKKHVLAGGKIGESFGILIK